MIIRELTNAEYDLRVSRLADILVDAVDGGAGVTFMWPLEKTVAENFWRGIGSSMRNGQVVQFIAEVDGAIAGTVLLQRAQAPNQPHRCKVAKLLVHRDFRRQGLGTLLMQALEAKARALGLTLITFDSVAHGNTEEFYRALGFTCAGYIPEYAFAKGKLDDTALFYKLLRQP